MSQQISPRELLDRDNYAIIEDFIPAHKAQEYYDIFRHDSVKYPEKFIQDPQCPKSISCYNYRWFLELLVDRTPVISYILGEPALPTYSYARIYANGEVLEKHKDRPACEVSVTLHLGSDGTEWPIYFTKPDGTKASAILKPGQAAIYLGIISEHWRTKFKGQHYGQVFFHYVKSRGAHWECYFDKQRKY